MPSNPFNSKAAVENSSYCRPDVPNSPNRLVYVDSNERPQALAEHVHAQFRAMVLNPAFPCVLGRSAFTNNAYRFGLYDEMTNPDSLQGLCRDLFKFVQEQPLEHEFSTFIASFCSPQPKSEVDFEQALWALLQALHEQDVAHHEWDPTTSPDPKSPDFSFSFAGRSYFLVGVHAQGSRFSRRFTYPTVAFNAHYQFQNLRRDGRFEKFQQVIRDNDMRLQGDINPSLTNYGDDSEAKQYSGRLVEPDWMCPFRHKRS